MEKLLWAVQASMYGINVKKEYFVAQRLGFILDQLDGGKVTGLLAEWISSEKSIYVPLNPKKQLPPELIDSKWRIYVNEFFEMNANEVINNI